MNILTHLNTKSEQGIFSLSPVRRWLENIEIKNRKLAQFICKLIPSSCPFERTIVLFGRTLIRIPPLCHLNPFYEEFISLRFRALTFLSEQG